MLLHWVQSWKGEKMSRPKYYWYGIANKMVNRYHKLNKSKPMEREFKNAIDRQLLVTLDSDEGKEKVKVIESVCLDHRITYKEAADEMNWSERKIQGWINEFVNAVGKRVGF